MQTTLPRHGEDRAPPCTRHPWPACWLPATLSSTFTIPGFSSSSLRSPGELSLSNTSVGFLNTARSFAGSGSNVPAGFVADRFSNHWGRILGLAMIVIGIFQFIMGSVDAYWPILLCAMVVSVATSFWHPPAIAALSLRFARQRGFAISLHGSGGSIGEALGPILVGTLLGFLTWQAIMHLSLAPAVLTGVVVWFLMRNTAGPREWYSLVPPLCWRPAGIHREPAARSDLPVRGCVQHGAGRYEHLLAYLPPERAELRAYCCGRLFVSGPGCWHRLIPGAGPPIRPFQPSDGPRSESCCSWGPASLHSASFPRACPHRVRRLGSAHSCFP